MLWRVKDKQVILITFYQPAAANVTGEAKIIHLPRVVT